MKQTSENKFLTVKKRKGQIAKHSGPCLWSHYPEETHKCLARLKYIVRPIAKPTSTSPQTPISTEAGICQPGHLRGLLSSLTSLQALIIYCPNASSLVPRAYTSLEAFYRFLNESSMLIIPPMNFLGCTSWFYIKDECIRSIFLATLSGWRVWAEQALMPDWKRLQYIIHGVVPSFSWCVLWEAQPNDAHIFSVQPSC